MEPNRPAIELKDWLILDALSDDYESIEQMTEMVQPEWECPDPLEIIERLERLHAAGHVFVTLGEMFNRAEIVREIDQTRERRFWFGRTSSGDALWQLHKTTFGY